MLGHNVDFVVASKTTNNFFHANWCDVLEFDHIITTWKSIFSSQFTNSRVEFNRRQANEVARTLGEEAPL
ncbi:hypothetical protein MTR_4g128080 [Medicago truncatula]|uniref:RNase H type-1 domain-containing protein n=1 Tax=Medicago truncatula TaxID=3880 RepID=G7JVF3_MEDTR|nr:hypothetical protein MTR_4g128080 [Medicago truncatula]